MTIRNILIYPGEEANLRKPSAPIKRLDDDTRALIADLKETLLVNPGAGLSAPQIGVFLRAAAVRFGQEEGEIGAPQVYINPQIVKRGPLAKGFDGCLSMPNVATWDTLRPSWLVFTAKDEHWRTIRVKVEGIDARLVDHEIDHLNGKLFLDLLKPDSKLYLATKDEKGEDTFVQINRLAGK
jgi:peptide deformylase